MMVKNCTECAKNAHCIELIKKGTVVYCGSSMCKPVEKEQSQ